MAHKEEVSKTSSFYSARALRFLRIAIVVMSFLIFSAFSALLYGIFVGKDSSTGVSRDDVLLHHAISSGTRVRFFFDTGKIYVVTSKPNESRGDDSKSDYIEITIYDSDKMAIIGRLNFTCAAEANKSAAEANKSAAEASKSSFFSSAGQHRLSFICDSMS